MNIIKNFDTFLNENLESNREMFRYYGSEFDDSLYADATIVINMFHCDDDILITYNLDDYKTYIFDYDNILSTELQDKLIEFIKSNTTLLDDVEALIFKHATDTSIEEFINSLNDVNIFHY